MRTAFYISDGTAITAEVFGHALLSLFPTEFNHKTIPFVETEEQAYAVIEKISESFQDTGERPLVFYTVVNPDVRRVIARSVGINYNFLDHWDEILPGAVLRVQHEDVLDDLDGQVKRMLDYLGVPFEQACLDFHQTDRLIKTPSAEQVRQPINRKGQGRWQPFEAHLGPLLKRFRA